MRCNICDKQLSDKEVVWNKELDAFEPCAYCLEAAMDAAYSDGFQHDDDTRGIVLVGEESDDDRVEFVAFKDYRPLGYTLEGDDDG